MPAEQIWTIYYLIFQGVLPWWSVNLSTRRTKITLEDRLLQLPLFEPSQSQFGRFQLILNSTARAVSQTHQQSGKPPYLHGLLNFQSNHLTHSSYIVTLQRPPVRSHLKLTDRSVIHYAPVLWNTLPKYLRQSSLITLHHSKWFSSSSCPLYSSALL